MPMLPDFGAGAARFRIPQVEVVIISAIGRIRVEDKMEAKS